MKDVYICFTPYHLILSCAIAFAKNDRIENDLIIQPSFPNVDNFIYGIKEWNDNLFDEIITIPGRYETKAHKTKIINVAENIYKNKQTNKLLKEKYGHTAINNLYVFNDNSFSGQFMAYLNEQNGGCNIYVEDGMAAYVNQISSKSIPQSLVHNIYKLTFGKWYEQIENQGQYKYIHKLMVLYPQHIRKDLSKKNIDTIKVEDIFNLNATGLPNEFAKQFNLNVSKKKDGTILILSPSYFLIKNGILDECKIIINQLLENNPNVLVKYHPAEKYYYLDDIISSEKIIPQSIPLEIIYLYLMDTPPTNVIGDISTSLMTSKLLLEKTNVISLANLYKYNNFSITNLFPKFGILMPDNINSLFEILT